MLPREPAGRAEPPASMPTRSDRLFRLYQRRIGRCRTENQINRIHIALDNYLTPAEVRHFTTALSTDIPDSPGRRWIARLSGFMPLNNARRVEFVRRELFRGVTLYTDGGESVNQKSLIIGFTGYFHRLMVPTGWFLDCLDPTLYDVVLLRDFARSMFVEGIPPLGANLADLLANLVRHVDPKAYRHSASIGTSGGGVPAVLSAIALNLDRGISLCGMEFARFAAKVAACGQHVEPYAAVLASRPQPFPELVLCYGAAHAADRAAAMTLHQDLPSQLAEISGCAEHTVLAWALMQGTLPELMSRLLGQSLERVG